LIGTVQPPHSYQAHILELIQQSAIIVVWGGKIDDAPKALVFWAEIQGILKSMTYA
jgi:hypothetical protein